MSSGFECRPQMSQLRVAPDQRHRAGVDVFVSRAQDTKSRLRVSLTLQNERRQGFEIEHYACQVSRRLADEDASRVRHGLEPLRGVDRIAHDCVRALDVASE